VRPWLLQRLTALLLLLVAVGVGVVYFSGGEMVMMSNAVHVVLGS